VIAVGLAMGLAVGQVSITTLRIVLVPPLEVGPPSITILQNRGPFRRRGRVYRQWTP
jgi:hypothetical protein